MLTVDGALNVDDLGQYLPSGFHIAAVLVDRRQVLQQVRHRGRGRAGDFALDVDGGLYLGDRLSPLSLTQESLGLFAMALLFGAGPSTRCYLSASNRGALFSWLVAAGTDDRAKIRSVVNRRYSLIPMGVMMLLVLGHSSWRDNHQNYCPR